MPEFRVCVHSGFNRHNPAFWPNMLRKGQSVRTDIRTYIQHNRARNYQAAITSSQITFESAKEIDRKINTFVEV
jgi:hypothetical protein